MTLRNLVFLALFTLAAAAHAQNAPVVLAYFKDKDSLKGWISVNDGVMGGVSKGGCKRTENGTLLFGGDLSLENNGGFASIRTEPRALNLKGVSAVVVKARGDGRTYWAELRTTGQMGASSYRADLPTQKGEWVETSIPLADFKLQAFGRSLPGGAVNPDKVDSIGFTLADKQAGPFELEIEQISGVTAPVAGDGNTIADLAAAAGTFKTLLAAAAAADLAGALSGPGPLTVFAPTDEAFARLPAGTVEDLLKPGNKGRLADILKYHVIAGRVPLAKVLELREGTTLQGSKLQAAFTDGRVLVGPATLLKADLKASNGLVHVIDQVLLPPESTGDPLTARGLIELAVDRGVPLFNDGHPAACAAVYEIACESLRILPDVSTASRVDLERALREMRMETTPRQKAWILRNALDRVFTRLPER